MRKVCIFIDVASQAIYVKNTFPKRKLDVTKYFNFCKNFGDIVRSSSYGVQFTEKSEKFINFLKHTGYETKFKSIEKGTWFSWDVGICMDVVKMISKCDAIILGTSHKNMIPLVLWAKEQGIKVIIIACNIDFDMKHACDQYIEINEDLLTNEVIDDRIQGTGETNSRGIEEETHSEQSVSKEDGG